MQSDRRFVALRAGWLLASLLAICSVGRVSVGQENKDRESQPAGPQVRLRSVYLKEPIGRAHQITIVGELGGSGQVTLDGNTCTLTQFGDPGVCTEIAFQPHDVKLAQLRLADPSGQGRRLYQLRGELEPAGSRYFLVVPRRRSGPHRLVVDLGNDLRRVVTLESIPESPRGKPELCKNAKYRAEQADGKVTLFARGENSSSGWKVSFEQLPIEIFPPQFRLVCVRPTGPAAQVITPFEATTSFSAKQTVQHVSVHDARGRHKVPVQQRE